MAPIASQSVRTYISSTLAFKFLVSFALQAAPAVFSYPQTPIHQSRTCTTALPSQISWLDQQAPDSALDGNRFHLAHLVGGGYDSVSLVTFAGIPEGATGCMLTMEIPVLVQSEVIASGSGTQADVWTVMPDDPPNATWNDQPQRVKKVSSTIPFPSQVTDKPFSTVLYADECRPEMSFLFELSPWQRDQYGVVGFANGRSLLYLQGEDTGPVGFFMVFNC